MKIKSMGNLYVQLSDILSLQNVPTCVFNEIPTGEYNHDYFVLILNEEAIAYIESSDEIIDYDTVKDLSDLELCNLMLDLYKKLDKLCEKYVDSNQRHRDIYLNNEEYSSKIYNLKYQLTVLEYYRSYRSNLVGCENCVRECKCGISSCCAFLPAEVLNKDKKLNFIKI